jgi:hypothetical protein
MSEAMVVGDLVEAVIISGPRRGEIVRVDLGRQETLSSEEINALHGALQRLDTALMGLAAESRDFRRTLREVAAEI